MLPMCFCLFYLAIEIGHCVYVFYGMNKSVVELLFMYITKIK